MKPKRISASPSETALPVLTADGVLPALVGEHTYPPPYTHHSPYVVSLIEYVARFGDTAQRREVIGGLLDFRSWWHDLGVVDGSQWLGGNLVERVESSEKHFPNDVPVVTFYRLPRNGTIGDLERDAPDLAKRGLIKAQYGVDSFLVHLGMDAPNLVRRTAYWYSRLAYRGSHRWAGFVQIDLAATEDIMAWAKLTELQA